MRITGIVAAMCFAVVVFGEPGTVGASPEAKLKRCQKRVAEQAKLIRSLRKRLAKHEPPPLPKVAPTPKVAPAPKVVPPTKRAVSKPPINPSKGAASADADYVAYRAIKRHIRRARPFIDNCFRWGIKKGKIRRRTLNIKLHLQYRANGTLAKLRTSARLSPGLMWCLRSKAKAWRVAAATKARTFVIPMMLSP